MKHLNFKNSMALGLSTALLFLSSQGTAFDIEESIPWEEPLTALPTYCAITTFAGGGEGSSDEGVPATAVRLSEVFDVAVDGAGDVYIAHMGNHRIRKVTCSSVVLPILYLPRP